MTVAAWLTLAVVVATVAVMATERVRPALAMVGAVTFLLVAGVVDAQQALAGFSNPAPITVAALYVLAAAARKTQLLAMVTGRVLARDGRARPSVELARVLAPTAAASALLNNTPIVAMTAPAVASWAHATGRSASRYLIPLSFAAILGGVVTLIGTSTNLVVSGLLQQAGHEPLGLFEITWVGLPFALAGLVVLALLAPRLLPERQAPGEAAAADAREFTVEMVVTGGRLAGRTVSEAGLRNLEGVFLVEIERDGTAIAPVAPEEPLVEGDRLIFAGNVDRVLDLQQTPGLVSAEERHFSVAGASSARRTYEIVVSADSRLVGSTLKEADFRARYGAVVLAIHRAGHRVRTKLGEVPLGPGDVLVVLAGSDFRARALDGRDFLVVAPLGWETTKAPEKTALVALVVAGLLVAAGTGLLDILPAALLAALALVAFGALSAAEARDAIDLNVIVLIAASFGLGAAMSVSGLAGSAAELVLRPLGGLGYAGLVLGVLVATALLTEIVTNNAAAVLMFPIALSAAEQAAVDPRGLAIAVALGASSSFLTPIGYQTNTMVYGLGGYRFGDFARLGLPLTLVMLVVALLVIPRVWPG
ncbi:MAG TPA: SLC13 family permease [Gaiellaceae bacterium]|nr:SLC13 family permease [Gaiellaceae bacterium]